MVVGLLLTLTTAAAVEPGPFVVGRRDVVFQDRAAGTVWATIHYPASEAGQDAAPDRSAAPYPVAAFLHGWLGSAWMYTQACDHLASLGFVVVNMDTETHPFLDYGDFATDTLAALDWVDARSAAPAHWLSGMASDGPWTAIGHSMGGATLARLLGQEPRFDTLVGFMPYESDDEDDYAAMRAFQGRALYLMGTEDDTSTSEIVGRWFDDMQQTSRGLIASVPGAGHQAITDFAFGEESMPDAEQLDAVLALAEGFLVAEVLGDPRGYRGLLFDPPVPLARFASRSVEPVFWLEAAGSDALDVGVLGPHEGDVVLYAGSGPGVTSTDGVGDLGLAEGREVGRLALADGVLAERLPVTGDLGRVWFQLAVLTDDGAVLGPAVDAFGVGVPEVPVDPPDGDDVPVDRAPADPLDPGDDPVGSGDDLVAAACGGCRQGAGGAGWAWAVLLLGLRRRR